MKVSARCDYACKALLELALHWPKDDPLKIYIISQRQGIPMRYLVHILIQLKRMGLVASVRGKEGGYNLAKEPNKISMGEVMRRMQGPLLPVANSNGKKEPLFASIWNEAEGTMTKVLDKITFWDICNRMENSDKALTYQI